MNLTTRKSQLDKAIAIKAQIALIEARLDAIDGQEGTLTDDLREAEQEFQTLVNLGERNRRIVILSDQIHALQEKLRTAAHEPSILQNTLRRLGSDFEGYRAIDWWWLKSWRIGREKDMGGPVDVEDERQCALWLGEVRAHADTFLGASEAASYVTESEGKLVRHRAELAAGRARNAEADAYAARLRADLAAEKANRAEENRERLEKSDQQRADYRAQLDLEMAAAKVAESLAFDRRVARKEVRRHAWLASYWAKIAKARDDKDFRDVWLERVFAKKPERGRQLQKVFRSAGDSASALRGAEQFDLIRQRWERVVVLLDADPTLTMDEAEDIADPEYREQRAEIKESDEDLLAARLEAQKEAAKEQIEGTAP